MSSQTGMLRPNERGDSRTAHTAEKPGPQKKADALASISTASPADAGFELLFSNHPHPMYVCDIESLRILEVNRAAVKAYGYSREEFLNMRITDIRPAEDVPRLLESVKAVGPGRISSRGYWRHRRKNGEIFDVDVTTQRIRFGGREASLAVALDIAERLAAEDKLAKHAAYVQALSENNPLAIVTLDLNRRVQMCNPAFEHLFGYPADELRGKELDSLIAPNGRKAEMLDLVGRAFSGEVVRVSTKRCRRDGSEVDVRIIGVPLVVNGKMIGTFGMYEDISDQVRAEEAQHRAEKKYERIFENAIEGFFESTPEGGFVTVNPALARIAGYSSAAEMIREVTDIRKLYVNPEERKDVMQQLEQRGILENYECRMLRKDGSKIWVSLNARALRDADGKVISHDGTAEDITGRRRAQLERNATTEIIRAVSATDNLDELLRLIHAALTNVLDADNCFVALLDPLTGLFHFPLFVDKFDPPPPTQKLDQSCTAYVFRSGRAMSIPQDAFDELAKSGEVELVGTPSASWLGAPLNTPSSTIGVVVVQNYYRQNAYDERDLIFLSSVAGQIALAIERKRAEERVRQSEARLRVLVEQLPAVLWTVDSDLRFTSALGLGLAQLGLKPNQLVGLSLSDYFAGAEPTFVPIAAHRRAIAGERVQFSLEWKDNSYACHVEPLRDSEGRVNGAICMSLDVTDRKKLEEQFRQAQKMEAVGRLAGGIAHDFNNLLMVIQGYADLLAERIPAGESLRRNAEQIQVAAQRAATLTQQLLAFSRKQMLAPKVLNVDSVVADMEKMLRRLIGEDIELRTSSTSDLWLVKADRGQIEQVIMNLAVNARDAMPHGGRLTIETANVEFDAAVSHPATAIPAGKYVMLAVTDNGVGMDEKTQAHIFEPFFTTKEKGKGTGLGLATVYGVVKQSGGYIWVYSEPGHGTTFKMYLPQIADEVSVGGRDRVSGTKDLPKGTEVVLLVEDEAGVRDLAREYLEMSNYTVIVAADGHTALELASMHAGPIDLLMTDVVMPGIGGRELAERIRRLRPGIKVLFMSGYTEQAVNQQGALGEDAILLQKPFTLPVLASKLREILAPEPVTP